MSYWSIDRMARNLDKTVSEIHQSGARTETTSVGTSQRHDCRLDASDVSQGRAMHGGPSICLPLH